MGVCGLWELLSPVGRRVSVETLAGKKLAIDASIWMIQFMKAMRDEKGEMVRNAHLLGFFRRICKLLYLRVKPIFVFDGGTPALKRRTVIARRRQRENAQAKIRKTAEKLLLNHLKARKLKEIAQDIKDQRQKQNSAAKGKKVLPDETKLSKNYSEKYDAISGSYNQEKLDEMLAASIAAEEDESLTYSKMMAPAAGLCEEDGDEDEDMMLPDMHGEVDSSVLAALAPSLQHKLIQKQEVDSKCKKTRSDEINILGIQSELGGAVVRNQVKLDEMLAASILAEEDGGVNNKASTSAAAISFEDGDADDESGDEEMILPTMHGKVDPAVLAALPPSMQLDLLVQIRERLMAENRQKYQKVKKDPGKFSELQIEAYLKTVAFRREIDQVQKAAAGRGVGGIQTSRIASESNRKFIFSSSFTGDKQVLAAGRAEKCGDKQQETLVHSSSSTNTVSSANKSNKTGSTPDDSRRVLDENIETYQDERGRMRVSRVRAMGIRMTRDLQRNLDLMKEIELERTSAHNISNSLSVLSGGNHDVPENFTGTSEVVGTSQDCGIGSVKVNERNEECMLETNGCIEISFEDNGDNKFVDGEDDLFACLVTGNNTGISSCDNTSSKNLLSISDSDCEWEEGAIEERGQGSLDNVGLKMELPAVDNISDDTEVEWEEVVCEDSKVIPPCPTNSVKLKSKGCVEEDADLEEAIRRSLEDIEYQRSDYTCQDEKQKVPLEKVHKVNCFLVEENKIDRLLSPVVNAAQPMGSNVEIMNAIEKVDAEQVAISNNCFCPNKPFKPSMESNSDDWTLVQVAIPCERECGSTEEQICYDREGGNLFKKETNYADFGPSGTEEFKVVEDHNLDASKDNGGISAFNTAGDKGNPCSDDDITDAVLVDKKNSPKAGPSSCSVEVDNSNISLVDSVTKELRSNIYDHQNLVTKENHEIFMEEVEKILENSTVKDNENVQVHFTEANLEEEIKTLEEECIYLGNEHKRLERNAESVSSEMFTECQELLQMFGLPYIIAPMEAEAQCAFMEKVNIVDGVVTDDSDAFLFGARSVYKNIFDDRKYVETYFMKDIENELGLTREKLICMALLLGSDYTEGVSGIGIVNAIEVVNAFSEEDGLKNFRDWVESPDPTILGKSNVQTGSSARKKCSKVGDGDISRYNVEEASRSHGNSPQDQKQQQSSAHIQETTQIFMDKHRKISKNWHIPLSFPSEAVISAYSCPQVDKSTESFTWGKPDHFVLRKLCWEKFGWVSQKADEILLPVLKEYSKHEIQLRLEAFYTFNERFAKVRSKRIKKAVKGIIGNRSSVMADDDSQKVSRSRENKRSKPIEPGDDETEMLSEQQIHGTVMGNWRSNRKKATSKHSQNRLTPGEEDLSEPSSFPEGGESTNRSSRVNGKGGGRRGKGRVVGRGKEKGSASFLTSETSSSDTGNNDDDAMKFSERSDGQEVRRSMRLRKPVDYTSNDVEIDDVDGSVYQSDKNCSPDMAEEKYLFSSSGMNEGAAASGVIEEKQQCADTFSLGEGSSRSYLEAGGGFCLDEGESDQLHDNRQDDSPEAELSDDYLKMGPGLTMVVDGIATNEDKSPAPATATISTSANLSRYSVVGASDGHALEQGADQVNTIVSNDNQNASDGTGKRSIGALSVMPNLRRKRRRN